MKLFIHLLVLAIIAAFGKIWFLYLFPQLDAVRIVTSFILSLTQRTEASKLW